MQMWQAAESSAGTAGFLAIDDQFPFGMVPRSADCLKNRCRFGFSYWHCFNQGCVHKNPSSKILKMLDLSLNNYIIAIPFQNLHPTLLFLFLSSLLSSLFSLPLPLPFSPSLTLPPPLLPL